MNLIAIADVYEVEVNEACSEWFRPLAMEAHTISRQDLPDFWDRVGLARQRRRALYAAAGKRARRALIFQYLERKRAQGTDMTTTVVLHWVKKIMGRGVDSRAVMQMFGTPGRTAADKSGVNPDDYAHEFAEVQQFMDGLLNLMEIRRGDATLRYERMLSTAVEKAMGMSPVERQEVTEKGPDEFEGEYLKLVWDRDAEVIDPAD